MCERSAELGMIAKRCDARLLYRCGAATATATAATAAATVGRSVGSQSQRENASSMGFSHTRQAKRAAAAPPVVAAAVRTPTKRCAPYVCVCASRQAVRMHERTHMSERPSMRACMRASARVCENVRVGDGVPMRYSTVHALPVAGTRVRAERHDVGVCSTRTAARTTHASRRQCVVCIERSLLLRFTHFTHTHTLDVGDVGAVRGAR